MKSMRFNNSIRTNRAIQIKNGIDSGGSAGSLKVYDLSTDYPDNVDSVLSGETLLGTAHFSYPCGTALSGELTFSTISGELAAASGTPDYARAFDSNGNPVADFIVTGPAGGGGIVVSSTTITEGAPLTILTAKITEGN